MSDTSWKLNGCLTPKKYVWQMTFLVLGAMFSFSRLYERRLLHGDRCFFQSFCMDGLEIMNVCSPSAGLMKLWPFQ